MPAIVDLDTLLARMQPTLDPGRYAFVVLPLGVSPDPASVIATMREPEGLSVVLAEHEAHALGLPITFTAAWITLTVHSDLAAVGLTAAFAEVLARAGIGCNVIAGVHHDHLFVPVERAQDAMEALQALQQAAASRFPPRRAT
jgi:hypothetical protein